jgi:valyl-tRNA synthetase
MSKSLGNSPDPLDLIAQYGADAVRLGMLLCSPAGNDILFDESQIEQGRNFCNKIWNAYRLYHQWEPLKDVEIRTYELEAIQWFENRLNRTLLENEEHFAQFRLSDALMNLYKLIWDDFCAVYLEAVKPHYGESITMEAKEATKLFFVQLMKAIHPYMPFISEEIYHSLFEGNIENPCVVSEYPIANKEKAFAMELPMQLVSEVRNIRAQKQISPKEKLSAWMENSESELVDFTSMISKLSNVEFQSNQRISNSNQTMFLVNKSEIWLELNLEIDVEAEKNKIQEEITYLEGFWKATNSKLTNEKFVANAKPEIVEKERQKLNDAETKLQNLRVQLSNLS